jgi:DnaK suppressor protein
LGAGRSGRPVIRIAESCMVSFKTRLSRSGVAVIERPVRRGCAVILDRPIQIDPGYRPSDDEPFMNDRQREYFRRKLHGWKQEILREANDTLLAMQSEGDLHADVADRASSETDRAIELRARDRQRKLIAKIDAAIARIDEGTYGYCEETGEPIALRRLDARPIATLSVEAQERHERRERIYRDD